MEVWEETTAASPAEPIELARDVTLRVVDETGLELGACAPDLERLADAPFEAHDRDSFADPVLCRLAALRRDRAASAGQVERRPEERPNAGRLADRA